MHEGEFWLNAGPHLLAEQALLRELQLFTLCFHLHMDKHWLSKSRDAFSHVSLWCSGKEFSQGDMIIYTAQEHTCFCKASRSSSHSLS